MYHFEKSLYYKNANHEKGYHILYHMFLTLILHEGDIRQGSLEYYIG